MTKAVYKKFTSSLILAASIALGSIASASANDTLFRIADDVLKETVFELPKSKKDPQPTRYNLWMYQNFMLMEGMTSLGEVTGNEEYKTYFNRNIDFFAAYQAKFGDTMKAGNAGKKKWYSKPVEMWQSGLIAAYAERQQTRPDPEFVRGMEIFEKLLKKAPRFDDGVLVRKKSKKRGLGVQVDDLYMLVPYWVRKAELTKDPKYLEKAIDESLHYFDYLWNEQTKLITPLWLLKDKAPYGLHWGRGNGWYILAMTDLLEFVPANHPKRAELLKDYHAFIDGIIARQTENGLWRQILDHSGLYEETSSSGMFTYSILKGVNEGWLNDSYKAVGIKGWKGLQTMVNDDYKILNVCPPSDISPDVEFYSIKRAPRVHDQHGLGPFILAGAEYLKLQAKTK